EKLRRGSHDIHLLHPAAHRSAFSPSGVSLPPRVVPSRRSSQRMKPRLRGSLHATALTMRNQGKCIKAPYDCSIMLACSSGMDETLAFGRRKVYKTADG